MNFDWEQKRHELMKMCLVDSVLNFYSIEGTKLVKNLDSMYIELTKKEVDFRRKQHYRQFDQKVNEFLKKVDQVEKLLIIEILAR